MSAIEAPHRIVREGRAVLLASPPVLDAAVAILRSGATLYDHAAAHPAAERLDGRGPVYVIPAPTAADGTAKFEVVAADGTGKSTDPAAAGERWVVRHYRRGGVMARLLGDRYLRLGRARALREAEASHAARLRGIDTPDVLVAAVYLAGPFYRADLATAHVPESMDLARVLFGADGPRPEDRLAACGAAAQLLERLPEAGVIHRDLNLKNVLIARSAAGPRAWLLDLDRCRIVDRATDRDRRAMRARFARSLAKWERLTGRSLPATERAALGMP